MNKYIVVEELLKQLNACKYATEKKTKRQVTYNDAINNMCRNIDAMPAADVIEIRHGRWYIETIRKYDLAYGTTAYEPVYRCSCCKGLTESYLRLNEPIMPEDADFPKWCGQCGAKMDEESEDESC